MAYIMKFNISSLQRTPQVCVLVSVSVYQYILNFSQLNTKWTLNSIRLKINTIGYFPWILRTVEIIRCILFCKSIKKECLILWTKKLMKSKFDQFNKLIKNQVFMTGVFLLNKKNYLKMLFKKYFYDYSNKNV